MGATITCPRCQMPAEVVMHDDKRSYNIHQTARRRGAPRCPNSLKPIS